MNNIEILAPAGSYDAMIAAVRNGANAVYLGAKTLNARRNASNFDDTELLETIKYCHARGVKVHQTLNTLMYDSEREDAINAIKTAVELGVDALIIQDLGVLRLAKSIAPDMALHASTQMAIHNLEGALEAEKLGFTRIVLARELSKEEIAHIAKNTKAEIEVFVHGALCMSVSGQCYLSSMIGERSGNRGLCAQPCRLPFKVEGGNEYALSLKDLSIADKINELEEIGVCSVKIEGRMKRPEYVAAAVSEVKKAINDNKIDYSTLKNVFSRSGFTNGYYTSNIDYDMFGTRQKDDVLAMSTVLKDLQKTYMNEMPLVPISLKFKATKDEPISLLCEDDLGNIVEEKGELPQIAINKPTTIEKAEQNLSKTGGTPFYVKNFTADIDDGLIIPASELNSIRRIVIDKLYSIREKMPLGKIENPPHMPKMKPETSINPQIRIRVSRASQLTKNIMEYADMIIMPLGEINVWVKKGGIITDKICGELNSIEFSTAYQIKLLNSLKEKGLNHIYAGNLWAINVAKSAGITNIHGGFNLNIFNSDSLIAYKNIGLCDTEISFELNINKIKALNSPIKYGVIAYGYLPLMTVRNCPVEAAIGCDNCTGWTKLTDRMNVDFFVNCDGGESKIYNSVPLFLADKQSDLKDLSFITLYFTKESPRECDEIISAYKNKGSFDGKITRGLYYRNVL